VYEVTDAPRYASKGTWVHTRGESTWTSEPTLRPLPRREYSTRNDYDIVEAVNRHTITPFGWTHEQDNVKVVQRCGATPKGLVREFGFNEYRLGTDGLSQAFTYWKEAAPFWERVRARWSDALASGLHLTYPVNEEARLVAFLKQAQVFRTAPDAEAVDTWLATALPSLVEPLEGGSSEQRRCTTLAGSGPP
jgi:hypothetical protein